MPQRGKDSTSTTTGRRTRGLSGILAGAIAFGLLVAAAEAGAQRAVQWTPDRSARLIAKDVGGDRWSIALNEDDGTAIGNVYPAGGGAPQLVWCVPTDLGGDPRRLRCKGTRGCDDWFDLGEVELPESFLSPPASCEAPAARATAPGATSSVSADAASAGSEAVRDSPSVLRIAPDGRRTLIAKDIDGKRWIVVYAPRSLALESRAPTRLFGTVFDPGGGDAEFVSCTGIFSPVLGESRFECWRAAACACAPCASDGWSPVGEVAVPDGFLEDRRCSTDGAAAGSGGAILPAPAADEESGFGRAVAIDGDAIAVSAPGRAVSVYEKRDGAWMRIARFEPNPGENRERFGHHLALSGKTLVVSADGGALVFERGTRTWLRRARLEVSSASEIFAVATSGSRIAILPGGRAGETPIEIFEGSGRIWRHVASLGRSDPLDEEQIVSVAMSGDTVVAGVRVGFGGASGAVRTFAHRGGQWTELARLDGPSDLADHSYGAAVATSGDRLVVGAPPPFSFPRLASSRVGVVYVYDRDPQGWRDVAKLGTCARDGGRFGATVAIAGDVVAVVPGIHGDGGSAGDVVLFARDGETWRESGRLAIADAASGVGAIGLTGRSLVVARPDEALAEVFSLDATEPLPPQSCPSPVAEVAWPEPDWRVDAPAAHGMNPRILQRARDYAFQSGKHTQGVVVVRHGAIVAEWYEDGRDADSFAASWSDAKSISSAVIGIAIDRGAIEGVDAGMASFIPEWAGTPKAQITLRDVLSMASGLAWSESYALVQPTLSDIAQMATTQRDQLAYVVDKPLGFYPPGAVFSYSSGDSMLLGAAIEAATGKTIGEYAREVLFDPIGMTRAEWWSDAVGHTLSYCCVDAPSREFARFGLLFARDGRWQDRQVVSSEWVRASTSRILVPREYGYGYQWWLDWTSYPADLFIARGWDGQFIYVSPSLDLVVVRSGHYVKDPGLPIADPSLFARYPSAGLVDGRGTIPPDDWNHTSFLEPIIESIVD